MVLQQLEEYGLFERKVIPGRPAHTVDSHQIGYGCAKNLPEIASFSIKYEPEIIFVN